MLFLVFQIDDERYALEASHIEEVVPLVALKELPGAPRSLAGILNYRGRPVPAVDLSQLIKGRAAEARLTTRIVLMNVQDPIRGPQLAGFIAENADSVLHRPRQAFVDPGLKVAGAPYLGPVLMDPDGSIQWLEEQRLLSDHLRDLLFSPPPAKHL